VLFLALLVVGGLLIWMLLDSRFTIRDMLGLTVMDCCLPGLLNRADTEPLERRWRCVPQPALAGFCF
jgi:hypothetical protein